MRMYGGNFYEMLSSIHSEKRGKVSLCSHTWDTRLRQKHSTAMRYFSSIHVFMSQLFLMRIKKRTNNYNVSNSPILEFELIFNSFVGGKLLIIFLVFVLFIYKILVSSTHYRFQGDFLHNFVCVIFLNFEFRWENIYM